MINYSVKKKPDHYKYLQISLYLCKTLFKNSIKRYFNTYRTPLKIKFEELSRSKNI